jgi:nucleotide-binding universal stress UspA family protein
VPERTAEHSAAPTLVVRGSTALKAWARGESSLNVVVGYDFSASADAALGWINELRQIGPCAVTVVHVAWLPGEFKRFGLGEYGPLLELGREVQGLLERDLKQKASAVLGGQNFHVRVMGSWGKPDLPLIEAARDANADLIVVGTHQRAGLSRFRLGSVSRSVLRHSPFTVAVVPLPKPGILAPGPIPNFRCVLVPTDFSDIANRAIPYAYSALARGGKVCLVHVISPAEDTPERRAEPDMRKHHLRGLIPEEAEARGIETVTEIVTHTEPATAICQAAERIGADLICLASHGRSGIAKTLLGSVAQEVMAQSTRPLLILRPQPQ